MYFDHVIARLSTRKMARLVQLLVALSVLCVRSQWMTKEAAQWAIDEFELQEAMRLPKLGIADRRSSSPFITGDGFRSHCTHICEDSNRCRMSPEEVKDGELVFIKSDLFDHFAKEIIDRIPSRFIAVIHNGDLSNPDGQTDARSIHMDGHVTSAKVEETYRSGKLMALHTVNLWWGNYSIGAARPPYAHCLPIGIESRQFPTGSNLTAFTDALKTLIVDKPVMNITQSANRSLLLVAFIPKHKVPDREKLLKLLHSRPGPPFYHEMDLSHDEWLAEITNHKFVLAPFGHGLDTYRLSEILLMGGIPVTRRSTISSCFDDSDNSFNGTDRGSLPIVILDSWANLTKDTLDLEWERLSKINNTFWDYKRLFLSQWINRIQKQTL